MSIDINPGPIFLTAYPFQIIEHNQGILLKRGSTQIWIKGENALDSVLIILTFCSGKVSDLSSILDAFPVFKREEITTLIGELLDKRFLIETSDKHFAEILQEESRMDVYYWECGKEPKGTEHLFSGYSISVIGVNQMSFDTIDALKKLGLAEIELIDYPPLRAIPKSDAVNQIIDLDSWKAKQRTKNEVVIACSDFGGQALLLELNQWCVDNGKLFLPAVAEGSKVDIGPLVIPFETACLQCVRSRQNAHLYDVDLERYAEEFANEGKEVSAIHPLANAFAANTIATELLRALGNISINYKPSLIELDLYHMELKKSLVLKMPRCAVCSAMKKNTSMKSTLRRREINN